MSLVLPTLAYQPATALENLRAEFRVHYGLPADAPVTAQDLGDLVAMMGQARARAQQAGAGARPATRVGLSAVIRAHQGAVARAKGYLSGNRAFDLTAADQPELIENLLAGPGDRDLPTARRLLRAVMMGERRLFHPGQISHQLADADAAEVTPELAARVGEVLAGMHDGDLARAFAQAGLRGVQPARAWRWVRHVRARAGWADQALHSLTGNPAFALAGDQRQRLIRLLLGAGASTRERLAALILVRFAKDPELEKMVAGGLLGRLEAVIPAGSASRGQLEQVRRTRLDEAGRVRAGIEPAVPFTFAVLSPDLADISFARPPGDEQVTRIAGAISRQSRDDIITALQSLPPSERPAAEWELGHFRVAMHDISQGSQDDADLMKRRWPPWTRRCPGCAPTTPCRSPRPRP